MPSNFCTSNKSETRSDASLSNRSIEAIGHPPAGSYRVDLEADQEAVSMTSRLTFTLPLRVHKLK